MGTQDAAGTFEPYRFQTRNINEGENKAHTKEGAQALGFRGSIVGGALVYGQMIRPLIQHYGEQWLGCHWFDLRFKFPAYDDDWVTSSVTPDTDSDQPHAFSVRATNEAGQELIVMQTHIPDTPPGVDALAGLEPIEWEGDRVQGSWERMELNKPFRRFRWKLSLSQQLSYCERTREDVAIFREGKTPPVHPGLVMAHGSFAVQHQFVMPFWIHTGSMILTRGVIRVGDEVELLCVPIEKWKRKDNEWVKFYQVYVVNGQPLVEVWKSSIITFVPRSLPA